MCIDKSVKRSKCLVSRPDISRPGFTGTKKIVRKKKTVWALADCEWCAAAPESPSACRAPGREKRNIHTDTQ